MTRIRAFLHQHSRLALAILLMAMAIRALVPQGYMVASGPLLLNVSVCADSLGHTTTQIAIPMKKDGSSHNGGGAGDGHCAFTSLSMGSLAAADPVLLLVAIAFILALGTTANTIPLPSIPARLRPPLRAPPAFHI